MTRAKTRSTSRRRSPSSGTTTPIRCAPPSSRARAHCAAASSSSRAAGNTRRPARACRPAGEQRDPSAAVADEHKVYFEGAWVATRVYDRAKLKTGNRIAGPAVITEFDSTTVVLAGFTAEVDRFQNILINPNGEA